MTLRECYDAMGGNYDEVMSRLRKEERVEKFMLKFPGDHSYENLINATEAGNQEEAFRAAHSIKGVSQNLGLLKLYKSSKELTEAIRPGQGQLSGPRIPSLLSQLTEDYQRTVKAILKYQEESVAQ